LLLIFNNKNKKGKSRAGQQAVGAKDKGKIQRVGDRYFFFSKKEGKAKETGNMSENGQRNYICFQTVGCLHYRYRLVHSWVSARMLNVQSKDSNFFTQGYNRELLERLWKVGD
jgi:hypothetical protein